MTRLASPHRARTRALAGSTLALAAALVGATAEGARTTAPAAQAAPSTPSPASGASAEGSAIQSDDSAGLRRGTINAIAADGARLQIQGTWCDVAPAIKVVRAGKPSTLDSLQAGEAIAFLVAPSAGVRPVIRMIYAP